MASVVRGAALANLLLLGTCVLGELRAAVEDRVGCADVGVGGMGPLEAMWLGGPAAFAEGPRSVLCVLPDVTARELGLATRVPLAIVTGEGVAIVIFSDVLLEML